MSRELGVALPFWLDRPDEEAVEIGLLAEAAGIETVWVGELASFDAFSLATAIGVQTERVRLKVGPLAVSVRSPVSIALGVASVATLTGRPVGVALGASSPPIVSGWHDRPWTNLAGRMRETIHVLRAPLDGGRVQFEGEHVRVHGFRLRAGGPCIRRGGPWCSGQPRRVNGGADPAANGGLAASSYPNRELGALPDMCRQCRVTAVEPGLVGRSHPRFSRP
jgi:alkanesulfonate monooxygenase SsuD/methylene tetrahydromethanopterin reductase-like flavin-dependent oxidoreductase (luciferase family)